MNSAGIRTFCMSLPGTTEDVKWEDHLCFSVGGKMYCSTSAGNGDHTCLKADAEEFEELCARPGLRPAPYLARNKWVQVERAGALTSAEWKRLLTASYQEVRKKLPLKVQRLLAPVE